MECIICYEPLFVTPTSAAPCGHVFHTACLDKWHKTIKKNCPLCKATSHRGSVPLYLSLDAGEEVRLKDSKSDVNSKPNQQLLIQLETHVEASKILGLDLEKVKKQRDKLAAKVKTLDSAQLQVERLNDSLQSKNEQCEALKRELSTLKSLGKLVNDFRVTEEYRQMIEKEDSKQLALTVGCLRIKLRHAHDASKRHEKDIHSTRQKCATLEEDNHTLNSRLADALKLIESYEKRLDILERGGTALPSTPMIDSPSIMSSPVINRASLTSERPSLSYHQGGSFAEPIVISPSPRSNPLKKPRYALTEVNSKKQAGNLGSSTDSPDWGAFGRPNLASKNLFLLPKKQEKLKKAAAATFRLARS